MYLVVASGTIGLEHREDMCRLDVCMCIRRSHLGCIGLEHREVCVGYCVCNGVVR